MREVDVETRVCRYARATYGLLALKFTSPARRSVPDRIFLADRRLTFFIEFKRPGGKATPKQKREHARLRARGHHVYVIDDPDEGKRVVDLEMELYA